MAILVYVRQFGLFWGYFRGYFRYFRLKNTLYNERRYKNGRKRRNNKMVNKN